MSKLFNAVQFNRIKKAKFDLSHERKMSLKMGNLVPMFVQEVLPGDSFRVNSEMLLRLQPLVSPVMHRLQVKTDFFFVPNRLVYDKWGEFITGGETGNTTEVHPYIEIDTVNYNGPFFAKGGLADYMGIPPFNPATLQNNLKINALPFRAYQLIYNEYYRDQNLQNKVPFDKTGGAETNGGACLTIRKSAWEKDYFTSCLPYAQKGGSVEAPISGDITAGSLRTADVRATNGGGLVGGDLTSNNGVMQAGTGVDAYMDVIGSGELDGAGININDLRYAVRLQEWLERNARAGSRYIESILAQFGVIGKDARLQRPEYLGGGMNPVVISEVLSTYQAADDSGYPQGTMKGHGIGTGSMMGFKRKFDEHGFVIGICRVLPKTAYQQGIPKEFRRFDKLEYAWPLFSQLGEQEVKNEELYFDPTATVSNSETFGYQSRYAEYKFKPSTVHGDFRTTLDFWHMGRIFTAKPNLNANFIEADPTKRVFAVEDETEDEILLQLYNRVDAVRPLPYFNNPTI